MMHNPSALPASGDAMPLVSIMVPCFNAELTLPWALASVFAQSYQTWECIIVDDGSTDHPEAVIERLNDTRVHFYRFEQNRGRAHARQFALDHAHGDYLAMVDADDWIYPHKLEEQVWVMEHYPEVAVVSSGMAIVDRANAMWAARVMHHRASGLAIHPPLPAPEMPPLAFAPSLIRMSIAQAIAFDPRFPTAEDVDLLLSIALTHPYAVLSDITYSYSEVQTMRLSKILQANRYCRLMFRKHFNRFPWAVSKNVIRTHIKDAAYTLGFSSGLSTRMIRRRSSDPTHEQIADFCSAKHAVIETGLNLFGGTMLEAHFLAASG